MTLPAVALMGASAVDFARCLQGTADATCQSGARVAVRAVGAAGVTMPGAPANLSTSSSGSSVTLAWSAPTSGDAVTGYVIEAGSAPNLANLANVVTGSTATSFSADGVGNGTYYVRVRAQNAAGTSVASNESTLMVGSAACTTPPNAPSGLAIATSGSTVTLTWSAPAGTCAPTSYVLQAGSAPGLIDLANSNVGHATSYLATNVGSGTYYVRVRAANAYGQSAGSNEFTLTVGGGPAPAPAPGGIVGRWLGLDPDGGVSMGSCGREASDVQMILTQAGSTIAGTLTARTREAPPPGCNESDPIGTITTGSIVGTVNGSVATFTVTFTRPSGQLERGTGAVTFTATRMTGSFAVDPERPVLLTLNRQ